MVHSLISRKTVGADLSRTWPIDRPWYSSTNIPNAPLRRLLRKIEKEYKAAYNGRHVRLLIGKSRHELINAKMENVGRYGVELTKLVGEEEAARLIVHKERQGLH